MGLGNQPCKSRVSWHCPSVLWARGGHLQPHTSPLLPVPLPAAQVSPGGCHSTQDGQRADPASWPGAECSLGGWGWAAPPWGLLLHPATSPGYFSSVACGSALAKVGHQLQKRTECPWSKATCYPHVPVPWPPLILTSELPLLWGRLGGSRVFPAFRFSSCSPRSHSLITACCN